MSKAKLIRALVMGVMVSALPLTATPTASAQPKDDDKMEEKAPKVPSDVPADRKLIYRIDLVGNFGHEVTFTPLKKIMDDAKKWNPDYLVFYVNLSFERYGQTFSEHEANPALTSYAFNQLETARELQTLMTDRIRDDPDWKTRTGEKPQLIMWVKRALGGAAFVPFVAPKIYYTSDGQHGGIGYLEYIFAGVGDYDAREKQYSLRMGRAEGLAYKGGHEPLIIRAMAFMREWLSVSYVGGKPVFFRDNSGDELLTDDGDAEAGRRDSFDDALRGHGNDCLNLDASSALKLGLSAGTIDTNEDLADALGIARSFTLVRGKSSEVIKRWGKDVNAAERELNNKYREFQRTPIEGQTPSDRNRGRGKRLRLLKEMIEIFNKYGEAMNPREIQQVPPKNELEIGIEQIKQQMRQDR
ncbi:MAG: hypothetical protein AB7K52_08940 [Phycisphaerales bacterium]